MKSTYTNRAPEVYGPYTQAISANGFVFVSGQLPLDPLTMELVEGGIRPQTIQALKNIAEILSAAGSSMNKVVRCIVYLTDLGDFAAMSESYATFFCGTLPARSTIGVAALPRGSLIEIEATAVEG